MIEIMPQIDLLNETNKHINDTKTQIDLINETKTQLSDDTIINFITYALENKNKSLVIKTLKTINKYIKFNSSQTYWKILFFNMYPHMSHIDLFIESLIKFDPFCILRLYPLLSVSKWWSIAKDIFRIFRHITNSDKLNHCVDILNHRFDLICLCQKYDSNSLEKFQMSSDALQYIFKDIDTSKTNPVKIFQKIYRIFLKHQYITINIDNWFIYENNQWIEKSIDYELFKNNLFNLILKICQNMTFFSINTDNILEKSQYIKQIQMLLNLIDYYTNEENNYTLYLLFYKSNPNYNILNILNISTNSLSKLNNNIDF